MLLNKTYKEALLREPNSLELGQCPEGLLGAAQELLSCSRHPAESCAPMQGNLATTYDK